MLASKEFRLTPDVEKSYLQQNLPIRRQSLVMCPASSYGSGYRRRRCVSNPNQSDVPQQEPKIMTPPSPASKFVEKLRPSKSELPNPKKKSTEGRLKHVFSKLQKKPHPCQPIYTALLSCVAKEFVTRVCTKHDTFTGTEAVNCLLDILRIQDRNVGLLVGRSLGNQALIHHSVKQCRLRDLEHELYQVQKVSVNGVFTLLTDCYSPTCTRKSPCYSISCPRMKRKKSTETCRSSSAHLSRTEPVYAKSRDLWRYSVPLDIVRETDDREKKRQECIYELVYTEQDFNRDLQYLKQFWVQPIQTGDIIPIGSRQDFVTHVFWNLAEIESISSSLSKALTTRQDKHSVIPCIGDIMIAYAKRFDPFVSYGAHQMIGKHRFEREKKTNARFFQFAQTLERRPESRRLELNGYLTKPIARLGRYNLLLASIHQLTAKDHQDYTDLPIAMNLITHFLVQLDHQVGLSENSFHLQQLAKHLLPFKGPNLDLLHANRRLILHGRMKRTKTAGLQLFLFDHYLIICKIKLNNQQLEYYKLYQQVINKYIYSIQFLSTISMSPYPIQIRCVLSTLKTPPLKNPLWFCL
ncbi:Dbl homology domain-containing protein [Sporodiniella umbellata]|nr:Dbl homology domain-containing protein [Sporodiniella umbellata]